MASKEQTHSNDKPRAKQRLLKSATESLAVLAQQQTHPGTLIQRARFDPRSLTPSNVLQLQRTIIGNQAVGRLLAQHQPIQKKENKTGLPDNVKAGVEDLFDMSMDDVKVHYSSSKPAKLQAHAYAQGTDIHLGPGQEKLLSHEVWHVVQQKQGRVKPTMQMKGAQVNDDTGLENEADVMGAQTEQFTTTQQSTQPTPKTVMGITGNVPQSGKPIQRKVRDLPIEGMEDVLGKELFKKLEFYNTGPLHKDLKDDQLRQQLEKDAKFLNFYLSPLYEKITGSNKKLLDLIKEVQRQQAEITTLKNVALVEGSKKDRPEGTITFTPAFPSPGKPVNKKQVFSVDCIKATINGKPYHLYAGQDFLNTDYSLKLHKTEPPKSGTIPIYQMHAPDLEGVGYTLGAVGDAHHRFVWGAFHEQSLTATLVPQKIHEYKKWSEVTYKHNPKDEYKFAKDDPETTKLFNAAVSPLEDYVGQFSADPEKFIKETLKKIKKRDHLIVENDEYDKVHKHLSELVKKANVTKYQKKVEALMKGANNKEYAESIGEILLNQSFDSGPPNVVLGPAESTGYYSPDYHVIVLDPDKNPNDDAKLDTLAFETGNALQRKGFLAKKGIKGSKESIEFETMKGYIDMMMKATGTKNIDELVKKLGIKTKYLVKAKPVDSIKQKEFVPAMPSTGDLSDQKMRSALAWWKMKDWTENQRKEYFGASAHAKGMGSTGSAYAKNVWN